MSLIVQKYGGTSVASPERIKNVAKRVIKEHNLNNKVVVVVSAMGDTTDRLINLMNRISPDPHPREVDMLLTTGEQQSIALLTMAIHEYGYPAISLTGSQAKIQTDDNHNRAEIKQVENDRILQELNKGKIVVVAGFQGVNSRDDYTTLGRGGSDTTTVALAASLQADRCEIYSDVEGIHTTDPALVSSARKLDYISYQEMLELANLGAEVLHPRAVELAKAFGLELYIASSFNNSPGTVVKGVDKMEKRRNVTGVTKDENEVKVTVKKIPDQPGVAGRLFTKLGDKGVNVDMIIQNLQYNNMNDITFTIDKKDLARSQKYIFQVAEELGAKDVEIDKEVAKISIVGAGMISTPGIAARMFKTLGEADINIQMITTSEIKISCLISEDKVIDAVRAIHTEFKLDGDQYQFETAGSK